VQFPIKRNKINIRKPESAEDLPDIDIEKKYCKIKREELAVFIDKVREAFGFLDDLPYIINHELMRRKKVLAECKAENFLSDVEMPDM